MYKASSSYIIASQDLTRQSRTKIVVDDIEYSGALYIKDYPKFSHKCEKMIGEFPIKSCEFSMWIKNGKIDLVGKEIKVYKGLILSDKTIEWIPQGVFFSENEDITTSDTGEYINVKCYDKAKKMSTLLYEDSNTYPIDGSDFIKNALSKYGYELEDEYFLSNITINKKPNFESKISLREVVRRFGEIHGCNCFFSRNGKVEIKQPYNTGLMYKFYSYKKLTIEDKYGTIDRAIIGNKNYNNAIVFPSKEDYPESKYGWSIKNNPLIDLAKQNYVEQVYDNIKNLSVVPFKADSIIDNFIIDINDIIQVQKKDGSYINLTVLSIETQDRIKCNLSCEVQSEDDTDYNLAGSAKNEIDKLRFDVDYNKQEINGLISKTDDTSKTVVTLEANLDGISQKVENFNSQAETIAKIELNLEQIKSSIGSITNTTTNAKGTGTLDLPDVLSSELLYLQIYPTSEDISYLYLDKNMYLTPDDYLLSRDIVFKGTNKEKRFTLPCDLLFLNSDCYDEFILNYESQEMYAIHRVGLDINGNKYALPEAQTQYFVYQGLILEDDDYKVKMLSFGSAYIYVRALAKNLNTSQYATKIELNSSIDITKRDITALVDEKITLVNGDIESLSTSLELTSSSLTSEVTRAKKAESDLSTRISQTEKNITLSVNGQISTVNNNIKNINASLELKLDTKNLISQINASADVIDLDSNRFSMRSTYSSIATDGKVKFTGGEIGKWVISENMLSSSDKKVGMCSSNVGTAGVVFWAGLNPWASSNWASEVPFYVTGKGHVHVDDIDAKGRVESNNGKIGGWNITETGLSNGKVFIHNSGASTVYTVADLIIIREYIMGHLELSPAMIEHYDFDGNGRIGATDYVKLQNMIGISMN